MSLTWKQKYKLEIENQLHNGLRGCVDLDESDDYIFQRCQIVLNGIRSYAREHPEIDG